MPVYLVKHARPDKQESAPPTQWTLSDQGVADAGRLADRLSNTRAARIYTSGEIKAAQTAQIIAGELDAEVIHDNRLIEHRRDTVELMPSSHFISAMAQLFDQPRRKVLGEETAEAAWHRFDTAVADAVDATPAGDDTIIVSHGTVIALLLQYRCDLDGFRVWREMGLPSYVVLDWNRNEIIERADRV